MLANLKEHEVTLPTADNTDTALSLRDLETAISSVMISCPGVSLVEMVLILLMWAWAQSEGKRRLNRETRDKRHQGCMGGVELVIYRYHRDLIEMNSSSGLLIEW